MKASDIKIGKEYAFRESSWSNPFRVRILAHEMRGPARRGGPDRNGWSIEFLDGSNYGFGGKGTTTFATSRQIDAEWETWEAEKAAKKKAMDEQQAAVEANSKAQEAAIADLNVMFALRGVTFEPRHTMQFTPTQLITLLQQFETGLVKAIRENS